VTETTFNLDSPATSNNQYFILVRFYYSSNEYFDINYIIKSSFVCSFFISVMAAWPIKFTEGSKSGKKHPLPIDLSTENTKAKRSAYEKERRPGRPFNRKWREMIKLQFTTITDRIRNKIRNGNWFPKFNINRKEQKFLPICLRLSTLLTIIKRSAYEKERRPVRSFNRKWKDKMNKQMTT
jgi:hypothetical protein